MQEKVTILNYYSTSASILIDRGGGSEGGQRGTANYSIPDKCFHVDVLPLRHD